ncbi:MAG TPA: AAA family ATPase [Polyangiaceae bacterium]|jgi:predicted kinase
MIPVPAPPGWNLDWEALDARFDWVRALRGCPQDPVHHAEGDVWIHTRMVLESLIRIPAWRALPEGERASVFWASLLHDVAKPECTRTEVDGKITARGHSTRGALLARRILWRLGLSFEAREAVCALVRFHQIPFFLIEKDDARRTAASISQAARCDHLALVAEADARGRRCADPDRILENTELFRELCVEYGCLRAPAPFPSDHARVLYLRGDTSDPAYHPHEDFRAQVTLMSGLPGAGKDTWLRTHAPELPVVSLDALREELDVDPAGPQGAVVQRAREQAREHLRAGRDFAWNATNLSRQLRRGLIQLALDYGARVRIVYVEAPESALRAQNRARSAVVPDAVIDRLLDRWEIPDLTEAHDVTFDVSAPAGSRPS